MPRHDPLREWTAQVATRFPDRPAARVRSPVGYSDNIAVARAVPPTAVVVHRAAPLGQKATTARRRLREPFRPGERKAGASRTTFDPHACCGPLVP